MKDKFTLLILAFLTETVIKYSEIKNLKLWIVTSDQKTILFISFFDFQTANFFQMVLIPT
jgi:hypothetical protein